MEKIKWFLVDHNYCLFNTLYGLNCKIICAFEFYFHGDQGLYSSIMIRFVFLVGANISDLWLSHRDVVGGPAQDVPSDGMWGVGVLQAPHIACKCSIYKINHTMKNWRQWLLMTSIPPWLWLEVVLSPPPPSLAPSDEFLQRQNLLHLFIAEHPLHHSDQHLVVAGSQDQDTSSLALGPVWSVM